MSNIIVLICKHAYFFHRGTVMPAEHITAGFENAVNRDDVHMVSISAAYHFSDGTVEGNGPKQVNLGYGGYDVLLSSLTTKNCTTLIGSMVMLQDGFAPHPLQKRVDDPKGILMHRFVVGIKNQPSAGEPLGPEHFEIQVLADPS